MRKSVLARALIFILLLTQLAGPSQATPDNIYIQRVDAEGFIGFGYSGGGGPSGSTQTANSIPTSLFTNFRPVLGSTSEIKVAMLSSGVDTTVLPTGLASRITQPFGPSGDTTGVGTYAASTMLQLVEDATDISITSYGIYPESKFGLDWLSGALHDVTQIMGDSDPSNDFDVVVLAFPPNDFLDPTSAALGTTFTANAEEKNALDEVVKGIYRDPYSVSGTSLYGIPTDNSIYSSVNRSYEGAKYLSSYRRLAITWSRAIKQIRYLKDHGVSVVIGAGDASGPNPQTIMGLANLQEVITVGGFNVSDTANPNGSLLPKEAPAQASISR